VSALEIELRLRRKVKMGKMKHRRKKVRNKK
jgi:hypothetical protein